MGCVPPWQREVSDSGSREEVSASESRVYLPLYQGGGVCLWVQGGVCLYIQREVSASRSRSEVLTLNPGVRF